MKKNVIALLLAVVMASSSIGTMPALAAETTAEAAVAVEGEIVEEAADISEATDISEETDAVEMPDMVAQEEAAVEEKSAEDSTEISEDVASDESDKDKTETALVEETEEEPEQDSTESVEETEVIEESSNDRTESVSDDEAEEYVDEETEDEGSRDPAMAGEGEVIASGDCSATEDDHVTWTLTGSEDEMTLTISGNGAMKKFTYPTVYDCPWLSYKIHISNVAIENGVTNVGNCALMNCSKVTSVELPDSITSIGYKALSGCSSLTSITIPDSITSIGYYAFESCYNLTDVYFLGSEEKWDSIKIEKSGNEYLSKANIHFNALYLKAELPEDQYKWMYTGESIYPNPIVKNNKGNDLTEGADYSLAYENNREPGIARILVNGIGDYEGQSATVEFEIKKNTISLSTDKETADIGEIVTIKAFIDSAESKENVGNWEFTITNQDGSNDAEILSAMLDYDIAHDYVYTLRFKPAKAGISTIQFSDGIEGGASESIQITVNLGVPDNIKGRVVHQVNGSSSIKVSWDGVESADGYVLRYIVGADIGGMQEIDLPDEELDNNADSETSGSCSYEWSLNNIVGRVVHVTVLAYKEADSGRIESKAPEAVELGMITYEISNERLYIVDWKTDALEFQNENEVPWSGNPVKGIVVHDGVDKIGDYAFKGVDSARFIWIQTSSVIPIGEEALPAEPIAIYLKEESNWNPDELTEQNDSDSWIIWKFGTDEETQKRTLHIGGKGVLPDLDQEFLPLVAVPWSSSIDRVEEVHIDGDITGIGDYYFDQYSALERILIPSSVSTIGDCCFNSCTAMENIVIPDGVRAIGKELFSNCTNMTKTVIHEDVEEVGADIFINSPSNVCYCYSGTYIEEYCRTNGLTYQCFDKGSTDSQGSDVGFRADRDGWNLVNTKLVMGDNWASTRFNADKLGITIAGKALAGIINTANTISTNPGWCQGMCILAAGNYLGKIDLRTYFSSEGNDLCSYGYDKVIDERKRQFTAFNSDNDIIQYLSNATNLQYASTFRACRVWKENTIGLEDYLRSNDSYPVIINIGKDHTYFENYAPIDDQFSHTVIIDKTQRFSITDSEITFGVYDPSYPRLPIHLDNPTVFYGMRSEITVRIDSDHKIQGWDYKVYQTSAEECVEQESDAGYSWFSFYDLRNTSSTFYTAEQPFIGTEKDILILRIGEDIVLSVPETAVLGPIIGPMKEVVDIIDIIHDYNEVYYILEVPKEPLTIQSEEGISAIVLSEGNYGYVSGCKQATLDMEHGTIDIPSDSDDAIEVMLQSNATSDRNAISYVGSISNGEYHFSLDGEGNAALETSNSDTVLDITVATIGSSKTYNSVSSQEMAAISFDTVFENGLHSFGEWRTTQAPTYTGEGCRERVCQVCGHTEREVIPVLTRIKLDETTITGISNKTFTGSALTQPVIVNYGNAKLVQGIDYTVSYNNNTNAGTATVSITGKGNYTGNVTKTFTINKAAQSITAKSSASTVSVGKTASVSTTGAKGAVTYSSSDAAVAAVDSKTGKVTAKKVGTVTITAQSAATANYNAASKAVTVKVVPAATASLSTANLSTGIKLTWKKVTGANGYIIYRNGTKIKTITSGTTVTYSDKKANTNGTKYTYKVVAKATTGTSTLSRSRIIYRVARTAISSLASGTAGKMTVKWKRNSKANGYQVQYSKSKSFSSGNKTATITKNTLLNKTIGSLTKGKKYYVRVRCCKTVSGKKYYSAWSAVKTVTVKK